MPPFPVEALLDPGVYPERPSSVGLVQTHISWVFLVGDHVYKVKKPVNLGFLDFTTLEARRHFCHREVELNRRLSPNVYLDVVEVTREDDRVAIGGAGEVIEYAVKMRRLPRERMMEVMLERGQVTPEMVGRVARLLADFHRRAESNKEISYYGGLDTLHQNTEENFAQMEAYFGRSLSAERHQHIATWTRRFLAERASLFQKRVAEGKIKDCHGDVHCAHVCLEDGVSIYDCIEFNERFRYTDVAAEVAFLAMDLDAHGHPELSHHFVIAYIEASKDDELPRLLSFYKCYRAYVRGKVESLQLDEPEVPSPQKEEALRRARHYFDLAHAYTLGNNLVVLCGLVGTGKTHLARALSQRAGYAVISSDVVRKELAGMPATERRFEEFGAGIYSPEFSTRTYDEMFRRAAPYLLFGQSVVLDASFKRAEERLRAQALAEEQGAHFLLVECVCDEATIRERLEARQREKTASDGRWEIYEAQKKDFHPVREVSAPHHLVVDTARPTEEVVEDIVTGIAALS